MSRRQRLLGILGAACLIWGLGRVGSAEARLHQTRDEALRGVFPAARIETLTAYLTPALVESVRALARAHYTAPRCTYYEASRGDTLLGRAYIDTHVVRTMPEALLVAVGPEGRVLAVEILAFHEPEDYLPPRRWWQRLGGRTLSPHLRPGDGVDAITGATLSARAATEAVRRALALDHVLRGARP
jgi:hypothetical protein